MKNVCRAMYEVGCELLHDESTQTRARHLYTEAKVDCRNHLESIQNLWYLATLDSDRPDRVKSHLRSMEKHLHDLSETMQSF